VASLKVRTVLAILKSILLGAVPFALLVIAVGLKGYEREISCEGHQLTTITIGDLRFTGTSERIRFPTSSWNNTCPEVAAERFTYRVEHNGGMEDILNVRLMPTDMSLRAVSSRSGTPAPDGEEVTEIEDSSSKPNFVQRRGLFLREGHSGLYRCSISAEGAGCLVQFTIPSKQGWIMAGKWVNLGSRRQAGTALALEAIDATIPVIRSIHHTF
jgi:hypothetical protein